MHASDVHRTLQRAARNNTVALTATDWSPEFAELLSSWACNVRHAGWAPVVWSLDERMHRELRAQAPGGRRERDALRSVYLPSLQVPSHANEYKRPAGEEYTAAVSLKPRVMQRVLDLGFDLLFLDVDVALLGDPSPWLMRHQGADMQLSLNYDDHPEAVRFSQNGSPDLNTGVVYARSNPRTRQLVSLWARRTAERHRCSRRFPLWNCGDQEQLTRLVKECGYRSPSFDEAAQLLDNRPQTVRGQCVAKLAAAGNVADADVDAAAEAPLQIETLPPRVFASGRSAKLWRAESRPFGLVPRTVLTFHPNFLGSAGGVKKAKLQSLRLAPRQAATAPDGGARTAHRSAWCTDTG